ncbi:FRG domain-containing protein [Gemmatimonas sp.]|uniref:FRG domain-containing protein n=1 Tax=Gemmatimonas sp. TaxID=1962908 RepID=UPI0022CA0DA7|nr:FRG domain-containing protein [Gemmatimonas sp.]MCZ8203725.1 FRG domain-containing protein [Gemmatimonas sp.]
MRAIGTSQLFSYFDASAEPREAKYTEIRKGVGHPVKSFMDLAKKVAELQYRNPELELLFRGQNSDHQNLQKNSTLKPTILRSAKGSRQPPARALLHERFERLAQAEQQLVALFEAKDLLPKTQLRRQRILRWAILQHYEVCATPLLDVSRSLRIAASFATVGAENEAYIYVLGVPNLSGVLTVSIDSGIQTIKLAGICPPAALRPHIQEGYLMAEFPEMGAFDQKLEYEHYETDFGRRLVAKFRFNPKTFWADRSFPRVPQRALYPDAHDSLAKLLKSIRLPSPKAPR